MRTIVALGVGFMLGRYVTKLIAENAKLREDLTKARATTA